MKRVESSNTALQILFLRPLLHVFARLNGFWRIAWSFVFVIVIEQLPIELREQFTEMREMDLQVQSKNLSVIILTSSNGHYLYVENTSSHRFFTQFSFMYFMKWMTSEQNRVAWCSREQTILICDMLSAYNLHTVKLSLPIITHNNTAKSVGTTTLSTKMAKNGFCLSE